jgi:hypothetical protein
MTFDRSPAPAPSRQRPLATRRWRYAVALAAIVALAWLARGSFLAHQQGCDAFTWSDPDGYLLKARALAPTPRSWQWSHAAVAYQDYVKAPGYPVFLSLFRGFGRGFEAAAAIAQILLGGVGVIAAWQLGRALAGRRAGLLAAVAHALWFPAIGSTAAFLQEQLYVPLLLLAAALFVRAVSLRAPPRSFAAAGLAFGAAALVRSLPLYLALPLALVHVVVARDRRRAVTQAAGFLAGLVLVVTPYVAFISFQEGRQVPIENVGSFMLARTQTRLAPAELAGPA